MLYVGSREGRKGIEQGFSSSSNKRELVMEDTELEEGEACSYQDDDDPTFDPDVALSYIDEKLQNVLGHFQKDFEGGYSTESLGPKFGDYGSFLPAYRRSPVWSHPKSPSRVQNCRTPQPPSALPVEGRNQNSVATANASNFVKRGLASAHPASTNACNPRTQVGCVPMPKAQSIQEDLLPKPENRDHRTLKVRIKVGSDNLSVKKKKNTAIYSGLGLDGSPSSSFDDSLKESQGFSRGRTFDSSESPTQILQIMTSFPLFGGCVLSPLTDNLLELSEKPKHGPDSSTRASSKVNQRLGFRVKASKELPRENVKAFVDKEGPSLENKREISDKPIGLDIPSKDADFDVLSCDELITNALKLPLLSESYGNTYSDSAKSLTVKPNGLVKAAGRLTETSETTTRLGNSSELKDPGKQRVQKSSKHGDSVVSGRQKSSSGSKKKTKKSHARASAAEKQMVGSATDGAQVLRDNTNFDTKSPPLKADLENLSSEKDMKILKDKHADIFGDLNDQEVETMNSSDVVSKDRLRFSEVVEKDTLAHDNISREKRSSAQVCGDITSEMNNSGKSQRNNISGTPINGPSRNAFMPANGQAISDQAIGGADSDVWVKCDKCNKWRLLPPGSKENELPDKWLCSLQIWLPNMNRCGISEEECIRAVRERYNPLPEIRKTVDVPLDKLVTSTSAADLLHPIVPCDANMNGKSRKRSNSPAQDYLYGPSSSLKANQRSPKVRASAKSKDNQLTNAPQTKSSDMSLEMNKRKLLKHVQPDCHSDGGGKIPNIKARSGSEQEVSRASKRHKTRALQSGDSNRATSLVRGNEMFDVSSVNAAVAGTAEKDQLTNLDFVSSGNVKDETGGKRSKQELNAFPAAGSMRISQSDSGNIARKKRKGDSFEDPPNSTPSSGKRMDDKEQSRSKRYKVSKSEGKETSTSKRNGKADRKSKNISEPSTDHNESLPKDSVGASVAATSSSSKVTVSLKVKSKFQEMKGSPVESVSSSPLRSSNPDKLPSESKGIMENDTIEGRTNKKSLDFSLTDIQPKSGEGLRNRDLDGGADGLDRDKGCPSTARPFSRFVDERNESGGTLDATRSIDKNQKSKLNKEKGEVRMSETSVDVPDNIEVHEEKNDRKIRVQDNFDCNTDKYGQNAAQNQFSVSETKEQQKYNEQSTAKMSNSEKHEPLKSLSMKEKSQCLPPSDIKKNDTSNTLQRCQGNDTIASCTDLHPSDHPKEPRVNKKADSQNGIHQSQSKHSVSNGHRVKNKGAPSPHRRDSYSQAASTAIKEAKSIKHMADRLKNADTVESTGLYFEAALKFLQGASLLESGKTESSKQGDLVQAMQIYSDTAKLCRFCAHEYEKFRDMARAALAYKCVEVAYLRVVYSSHNTASRDRSELQTVLQMVPPGESPSSSASDIDNLNNTTNGDKAAQARNVDSPRLAGNLIIAARNRPSLSRVLSYAQDGISAMEASRKSLIAYGAASASMGHSTDGIASIKRALDFSFHDVEGLLRLVRIAGEAVPIK